VAVCAAYWFTVVLRLCVRIEGILIVKYYSVIISYYIIQHLF